MDYYVKRHYNQYQQCSIWKYPNYYMISTFPILKLFILKMKLNDKLLRNKWRVVNNILLKFLILIIKHVRI